MDEMFVVMAMMVVMDGDGAVGWRASGVWVWVFILLYPHSTKDMTDPSGMSAEASPPDSYNVYAVIHEG